MKDPDFRRLLIGHLLSGLACYCLLLAVVVGLGQALVLLLALVGR